VGLETLWNQFPGGNQDPDAVHSAGVERRTGAGLYELLIGFYPTLGPVESDPTPGTATDDGDSMGMEPA